MADSALSTASNRFIEVFPGNPPLDAKIKERILSLAGREATAAYQIASGHATENAKPYVQRALLSEPFTYTDWYNVSEDEWAGEKCLLGLKRRLLQERGRPFKKDGRWNTWPPCPRNRWIDFVKAVEENEEKKAFVKRIALPHQIRDLEWVSKNLIGLEELYLGALRDVGDLSEHLETTLFTNLTWLGIRDWRDLSGVTAITEQKIIDVVLPQCRNLKTLSIRGEYTPDPHINPNTCDKQKSQPFGCTHTIVCDFILRLADHIPDTVTTLELRLSIPFLSYFLEKLHELAPSIQRVGTDLGAWVQMYPLHETSGNECCEFRKTFTEEDVKNTADVAALQTRFDTYKAVRDKFRADGQTDSIPEAGSWGLPLLDESLDNEFNWAKDSPDSRLKKSKVKRKEPGFWKDEARNRSANHMDRCDAPGVDECTLDKSEHIVTAKLLNEAKVKTLPQMLKKLYDCRHKDQGGSQSIRLFALESESWTRGLDPVHPLALLQTVDEMDGDTGKTYGGVNPDHDMGQVYKWLEQIFRWRPVFDWDWFMVPDNMRDTVDIAYTKLFGTEYDTTTSVLIKRIRTHFNLLREAGIPVHLLIGRRSEQQSSCYWGWPYNENKWQDWLTRDFDASLLDIAPLVDILSIFYELRNPLDKDKLEEINALSPYIRPSATCPSVICPWKEDDICPFHIQRKPQGHTNRISPTKQKMANKQTLKPKRSQGQPTGYDRLANSSISAAPPVGENANDHPSDDSDSQDTPSIAVEHANPHHLARRAVYTREAVGWQRFWSTYALRFTSLSCLRIRMPRSFDKIGSWRLAKLLNQEQGWQISVYTDERQHIQTAEDILSTLPGGFEHEAEEKAWPAGRFVRRTWVWPRVDVQWKPPAAREQKADPTREVDNIFGDISEEVEGPHSSPTVIDKLELVAIPHPAWKNRVFTTKDWEDTRAHEAQEFLKAKATASISQESLSAYYSLPSSVSKLNDFHQVKKRDVMKMREVGREAWMKALHRHQLTFENALKEQEFYGKAHPLEIAAEKLYALLEVGGDAPIWKEGAEGRELKDFCGVRKRLLDQEESERAGFSAKAEEETRQAIMDPRAPGPRQVLASERLFEEILKADTETTSTPKPVHEMRLSEDNGKRKATSAPESEKSQPTKKFKETAPQLELEPEPESAPGPGPEPEVEVPVAEPEGKDEDKQEMETVKPTPKPKSTMKEKRPSKPRVPKAPKAPKATKPGPKAPTPDPGPKLELEVSPPPSVHSDLEPKSVGAQEWTDKLKRRPAKGGKRGAKGGKRKAAEKKTEPKKNKVVKEKVVKKATAPKKASEKKEEEIQSPVSRRLRSRK
jgi:hypothetical protein